MTQKSKGTGRLVSIVSYSRPSLVGAFSVIVQPVVVPMEHYTALVVRKVVSVEDGHLAG